MPVRPLGAKKWAFGETLLGATLVTLGLVGTTWRSLVDRPLAVQSLAIWAFLLLAWLEVARQARLRKRLPAPAPVEAEVFRKTPILIILLIANGLTLLALAAVALWRGVRP